MAVLAEDLSFPDWVAHVFDHPVAPRPRQWFWALDADEWPASDQRMGEYLVRLFSDAGALLVRHSDDEVAQGLDYLTLPGSPYANAVFHGEGGSETRVAVVKSMEELFAQVFAPRCGDRIANSDPGAGELERVGYMWWDKLPWGGHPGDPAWHAFDQQVLRTLEQTLYLPSALCQQAALHGLGHTAFRYPEPAREIVDRWLAHDRCPPSLESYALEARAGHVQ